MQDVREDGEVSDFDDVAKRTRVTLTEPEIREIIDSLTARLTRALGAKSACPTATALGEVKKALKRIENLP